MEVWRGSSMDRVGLLIIFSMLSIFVTVVVFVMRMSYKSENEPSERNTKKVTTVKSVLKTWKQRIEGNKAPIYKDTLNGSELDKVNEQSRHEDIETFRKQRL